MGEGLVIVLGMKVRGFDPCISSHQKESNEKLVRGKLKSKLSEVFISCDSICGTIIGKVSFCSS